MHTENGRSKYGLVGRGGDKLAEFLVRYPVDFRGKNVLDIGSSTGGWTEIALRAGAEKVVAVEKGTKQMRPELAADPRVELHEKTDIFGKRLSDLFLPRHSFVRLSLQGAQSRSSRDSHDLLEIKSAESPDKFNIILADVSFVSVRKVLEHVKGWGNEFIVLFKPQFEARPEDLNSGIVKNERIRREIIQSFEQWIKSQGLIVKAKMDMETEGRYGNTERIYYLAAGL